jgi:hypothetical protein
MTKTERARCTVRENQYRSADSAAAWNCSRVPLEQHPKSQNIATKREKSLNENEKGGRANAARPLNSPARSTTLQQFVRLGQLCSIYIMYEYVLTECKNA